MPNLPRKNEPRLVSNLAPYPLTTRFFSPTAKLLGFDKNLQTLPDGIVSVIGRVCARAHELNDMKAGASLLTPLQVAPKSVLIFLKMAAGAGAGAVFGGEFCGAWSGLV